MNKYVCTPRGAVLFVYPGQESVHYYDTDDGEALFQRNFYDDTWFEAPQIWRAVSSLPCRYAPNIEIARIDFYADQVLKDTLEDIRRMFRFANYDRWALAYRATHRRMPGAFEICADG